MKLSKIGGAVAAFFALCVLGGLAALGVFADDDLDDLDDLEPDLPAGRTSEQIAALVTNIDEVIETTAFYAAFSVLLLLLIVWALVQRKTAWALYAAMATVVLWWFAFLEQNLSGIFWTPVQFTLQTAILAGFGLAAANAVMAAALAPRRLRMIHAGLGAGYLVVAAISPTLGLAAICLALAFLQHFLPTSRIKTLFGRLLESRSMAAFALLPVLWFAPLLLELDEQFDIVFFNRIIAGLLTTGFITIYLARAITVLRDRDAAMAQRVADAKREAALNQSLLEAERGFAEARALANERSRRLAVASHDMRQPIMALRATMDAKIAADDTDAKTQMNAAFDYLDDLAGTYIAEAQDDAPNDAPLDAPPVSSAVLADTLDRMFRREAEAKSLTFTVTVPDHTIAADPLKLMRVLSNLVSNAVKHTDAGNVTITGTASDTGFAFAVTNSAAMANPDTAHIAYTKGDSSTGSGLGLSIVHDVIAQEPMTFDIDTATPNQTTCTVTVPLT